MKKFLLAFLVLATTLIACGQSSTPNIGLQIPATGSNNWYIPLNYNFSRLDLLLSGNSPLPNLSVTGAINVGGIVTAAGFVGPGGSGSALSNGAAQYSPAYFSAAGTGLVINGVTPFNGAAYYSTTAAPRAYLSSDLATMLKAGASGCNTTAQAYIPFSNTCIPVSGGGGATTFDQIGSGTNLGQGLVVGAGSVLAPSGGGFVSANEFNGVPFCSGFTPTNGQSIVYTTGGSPSPCYGAASAASTSFSGLTGGTNSTAAMVVGSGASLASTGSGVVDANQVNGTALPFSATVIGTNSSGQPVNASSAISASLLTGSGMTIGGDSICDGTGASNPVVNSFAVLLRPIIGGYWSKNCRPTDQLIDTTSVYNNTYMFPTDDGHYPLNILEDGTNNVTAASTSANGPNYATSFQLMYAHAIYDSAIAYTVKSYPAVSLTNWTATGSWGANTSQNSLEPDYVSTTSGNTLAYAVTCSASCVGILDYPVWDGNAGTFTVSLDGTPITVSYGGGGTTFYADGFNNVSIASGSSTNATFSKSAVRIPMSSGSHTITVTVTSSGANVGVNWFAVLPVASLTNPNAEAVSLQHQNNANDTLSGTYSGYISAIITQATTDGVNAYFANVRDAMLNTSVPINLYLAATNSTTTAAPLWVSGGLNTVSYYESQQPLTLVGSSPAQGQYTFSAGTFGFNIADTNTPLFLNYNANCGANETLMFANCYADALHPNDIGHAVYASVIASSLPSRLVTGNNVPQSTYAYRNYLTTRQFPSLMATPSGLYNLTHIPSGPGFYPGYSYGCFVEDCYFTTLTDAGGITEIGPNIGSGIIWSVASYNVQQQPSSESQLVPMLTMSGNGIFSTTTNVSYVNLHSAVLMDGCLSQFCHPLDVNFNQYFYDTGQQDVNIVNSNANGVAGIRMSAAGGQTWETGSGGSAVTVGQGVCDASAQWFIGNVTTPGTCTLAETMAANGVHIFLNGLVSKVYTVSTLPTASTVPVGTLLTVSDSTSIAPGTCVGGSSHYVTAISDGTNWNCP